MKSYNKSFGFIGSHKRIFLGTIQNFQTHSRRGSRDLSWVAPGCDEKKRKTKFTRSYSKECHALPHKPFLSGFRLQSMPQFASLFARCSTARRAIGCTSGESRGSDGNELAVGTFGQKSRLPGGYCHPVVGVRAGSRKVRIEFGGPQRLLDVLCDTLMSYIWDKIEEWAIRWIPDHTIFSFETTTFASFVL